MLRAFWLTTVVVVLALGARAEAVDSSDRAAALQLAKEGQAQYRAGHYADAADILERAYARYPEPVLLYNLGRARQRNGDTTLATDAFRRYLAIAPPDSRERPDAEKQLALLVQSAPVAKPVEKPVEPAPVVEKPVEPAPVVEPPKVAPVTPVPDVKPAPLVAPVVVTQPAPAPARTPVYKKWWLWTTVGVVAVGLGVGLGLGLGLHTATHYPSSQYPLY